MNSHYSASILALYARRDLGFWKRRGIERHLVHCEACSVVVREFQAIREVLARDANSLPQGVTEADWSGIAREMQANIRLGLSAGECVAPRFVSVPRPRLTLALAGLAVLIVFSGLERPASRLESPGIAHPENADVQTADVQTLESSGSGIQVRVAGQTLSVPAPQGREVIRTVDTRGELRSRYVDDSGVTIVNVYAE